MNGNDIRKKIRNFKHLAWNNEEKAMNIETDTINQFMILMQC